MASQDLARRIAGLSPHKRDLLIQRLREGGKEGGPAPDALPELSVRPEERHLPFPLSEIQQVYWLGRSGWFDCAGGANGYLELLLPGLGPDAVPRLGEALRHVIDRHEMLRVILLPDGTQRILERVPPYELASEDLRGLEPEAVEGRAQAVRRRMRSARPPFDRWPLFEYFVHVTDEGLLLHVRTETILIDGVSRNVIFGDLFHLLEDPAADLPPLECSYRDYVLTWRAFEESGLYRKSREHWLRILPQMPPPPRLPLARRLEPDVDAPFIDRSSRVLDAGSWARLKERAAGYGLTTSSLLVAAFAEVLALWTASSRFTLALVGTYRPAFHPQMYDIVGNFNTLLALAVERPEASFLEHALEVQERLRAGIDHWHYPGVRVLRELKRLHARDSRPATPVVFNSLLEFNQRKPDEKGKLRPGVPMRYRDGSLWVPQLLLLVTADEFGDDALYCRMQAREELMPEGYVAGLYAGYLGLLRLLASEESPWEATHPEIATLVDAPRPVEGLESRLGEIWEQILGVRPIGPDEDFFDLGGDSFSLVLMMNQVERELGPGPRLLDFFGEPTVRSLARLLRQRVFHNRCLPAKEETP